MKNKFSDSYVYTLFDIDKRTRIIGGHILPNIDSYELKGDMLAGVMSDIKMRGTGYSKERLLALLRSGKIRLVNAPEAHLHVWCVPNGHYGDLVAYCNIASKVRVQRDGNLAYQVREILGMVAVAYIVRSFFLNEKVILNNSQLIKTAGFFYTKMVARALDMLFAVTADPTLVDPMLTNAMVTKFYLRRVVEQSYSNKGREYSTISTILQNISKEYVKVADVVLARLDKIPDESFNTLPDLCKALSEEIPALGKLETNLLLRKMLMTFGEMSVLMLENPQLLFAYMISVTYSANLVRDHALGGIIPDPDLRAFTSTYFGLDGNPGE